MIFNAVAEKLFKNLLNGTTKVGKAADAEKLNGKKASYYAEAQSVEDIVDGTTPVAKAAAADNATFAINAASVDRASSATADGNGNDIAATYKTKAESSNIVFTEDSTTAPEDTTALWAHL